MSGHWAGVWILDPTAGPAIPGCVTQRLGSVRSILRNLGFLQGNIKEQYQIIVCEILWFSISSYSLWRNGPHWNSDASFLLIINTLFGPVPFTRNRTKINHFGFQVFEKRCNESKIVYIICLYNVLTFFCVYIWNLALSNDNCSVKHFLFLPL